MALHLKLLGRNIWIYKTTSKCLWFTHRAMGAHWELLLWVRGAGWESKLHDLLGFTLEPLSSPVKWEYYVIHRNGSITLLIRQLRGVSQVCKGLEPKSCCQWNVPSPFSPHSVCSSDRHDRLFWKAFMVLITMGAICRTKTKRNIF